MQPNNNFKAAANGSGSYQEGYVIMQDLLMTESDVLNAQEQWANGIIEIGKIFMDGGDYRSRAVEFVKENYAYAEGDVLFKPTMASIHQFRLNAEGAISYFVGGTYPEDGGFAIAPWKSIRFDNAAIHVEGTLGVAMGNYYLDRYNGEQVKVEYTFVFRKFDEHKIRIVTHHSSFPFKRDA